MGQHTRGFGKYLWTEGFSLVVSLGKIRPRVALRRSYFRPQQLWIKNLCLHNLYHQEILSLLVPPLVDYEVKYVLFAIMQHDFPIFWRQDSNNTASPFSTAYHTDVD